MMKKILVTGGTGSFGSALVDSFILNSGNINKLVVFSRDEKKQHDLKLIRKNQSVEYVIGDIRDKNKLLKVFKGVDIIFHAAALKYVPTGEEFPDEVIKTNILGTQNVIEAAEECGVKKVVNLSTDKAVAPINAYGMTKGLSEKLVAAHQGQTACVSLRYGNVIGSRGSVIPLFIDQVKNEKPLTITNLTMTRFLLTLPEAVFLSKLCAEKGEQGDLFVIKSPACTVRTLAQAISFHFTGDLLEEFEEIGIRPGEKIHETLLTSEEVTRGIEKMTVDGITYVRIPSKAGDEDYSQAVPFTSENTIQFNVNETLSLLENVGIF